MHSKKLWTKLLLCNTWSRVALLTNLATLTAVWACCKATVSITNLQEPTSKLSYSSRRPTRCWTIWSTEKSQMRSPTSSKALSTTTITSCAKKALITQPFLVHSACRTTTHPSFKTSVRLLIIIRACWSSLHRQMAKKMDSTKSRMTTPSSRWFKRTIRQHCSNIATTYLSVIWLISALIPDSADSKVPRPGTWRSSSFQPRSMRSKK